MPEVEVKKDPVRTDQSVKIDFMSIAGAEPMGMELLTIPPTESITWSYE